VGSAFEQLIIPNFGRDPAGGSLGFAALALNFHLEDRIGGLPVADSGVGHQGDEAVLEGLKAALDLALGLRRWSHEMRDVQRPQGTLELAARIGVMVAGAWPEEAQGVGIDRLGQTVALECLAKMLEVIPCGIALNEAARDKQARTVINGEQQGLLVRCRPPLVDRAVVLPEFADVSAAEAPIGALLGRKRGNQVGEVGFDVGFDGGAGSLEVALSFQFVGDELIVGRALHGQEALEEIDDLGRPILTPITSTGLGLIVGLVFEVVGAQFVEARAAYAETGSRADGVQSATVEITQDGTGKFRRQAVDELLLCMPAVSNNTRSNGNHAHGGQPPNPRSFPHWANGPGLDWRCCG
jgi:hypothetical protein